ncbi:hypothetical protein JDN41_03260 [Rhodomicrobium udaipurense]|uniref:Transposase n=2 Tax=Rhodomicrobium udaipurense TaxID=1202716 RepID=A0A8I1GFW9_9HYPH|nr:hypothetical protein [Rhodomicrobium udaipurense]MBJ7542570.1 hypothetical protein [Rhodomicrobium udaipurense]
MASGGLPGRWQQEGISSSQLHRTLGVTLKKARFHRIRKAKRAGSLATLMSGEGSIVEADEIFIGKEEGAVKHPNARCYAQKQAMLSLVERGGEVRSFVIDKADAANIKPRIKRLRCLPAVIRSVRCIVSATHSVNHANCLAAFRSCFRQELKPGS